MRYEILLFDADNTILDFDRSEEQALRLAFHDLRLQFSPQLLQVYRRNNIRQWQLFELGKISKDEVLVNRFVETFREMDMPLDIIDSISQLYERYLMLGYFVVPHAHDVLEQLSKNHRMYVVSNGVVSIQNSRMAGSGLDVYFRDRFLSEAVGCPKPQKGYFDYCFARIDGFAADKTLIIGDSLTSDIQGGVNAGIATCWFNPTHADNHSNLTPDYEIDDLRQLSAIV